MSILKKNTINNNDTEFTYTVSKIFLSNTEMMAFIYSVVDAVIHNEDDMPCYCVKYKYINDFTQAIYLDEASKSKIDDEPNVYEIMKDIKAQINMDQYLDMLQSVDEGIKYELDKENANFGLGTIDPAQMEQMIAETQGMVDKINSDPNIKKVVDMGINDKAIKMAQEQYKQEQIAKKQKQIDEMNQKVSE